MALRPFRIEFTEHALADLPERLGSGGLGRLTDEIERVKGAAHKHPER
jgi:hypothetical protein